MLPLVRLSSSSSRLIPASALRSPSSYRPCALLKTMSAPLDQQHFDFIVVGGGSGGLAAAKRAASYNAKVCIVEKARYGGTCVNVGCVPKKVMFNAAHVGEVLKEAKHFGYELAAPAEFHWARLKQARDNYIRRLNGIYESGLDKMNITRVSGTASFNGERNLLVDGATQLSAEHILIAVGGRPMELDIPGKELMINSDGFFELETQPRKCGIIGAGYIAVEIAGVLQGLGTQTSLFVRHDRALRHFDDMVSQNLDAAMKKSGIEVLGGSIPKAVTKEADGTLTLHLENGTSHGGFDQLICAIGRSPNTSSLNLERTAITTAPNGTLQVDEYQNTSHTGIYALGDVCGSVELTPMAIAAGRRLADRIFGGIPGAKADYNMVPTVVFSHPTIGTCGYTEKGAIAKFGQENIKVYNSSFVNLYYGSFYNGGVGDKPMSRFKLVCHLPEERVIGLHCFGMGSDEVLQGFAVAMKMGATKMDFDNCVAIHPTAAEELVTMPPWGLSGELSKYHPVTL